MNRLSVLIVSVVAIAFLSTGCSSLKVKTDFDADYDFSSLRTYTWIEGARGLDDDLNKDPAIRAPYTQAVNSTLQKKGYQHIENGKADFVVAIYGRREGAFRYSTMDMSMDTGFQLEGIVVIEITDPEAEEVVWQGEGRQDIQRVVSPEYRDKHSVKVVGKILKDFPPQ